LSKQSSLYDLTKNASGRSLRFGDAGSVDHLDCRTCNHERISAWSTYIDDIENIPSSLEVNKLWKIGGIVLASSILDKPADRASRKYGNNAIVNKLELLGDYVPVLAMGMSGMLSLGAQDPVLAKTSVAAFQAGLTSSGVVSVSKYLIGRDRPGVADSPYSFHSNTTSRDYSFPSLRTALAWATITPYAVTYDMPLLYALPLMTNFSRVSGGRHWFSDTLASAFVGFGLGNYFLNRRMSSPYVPDLLLSPGQMRLAWHL
jgi:membrane-associated phospholipid phosphatase